MWGMSLWQQYCLSKSVTHKASSRIKHGGDYTFSKLFVVLEMSFLMDLASARFFNKDHVKYILRDEWNGRGNDCSEMIAEWIFLPDLDDRQNVWLVVWKWVCQYKA